jgi:anthranilate synthase/aminodeoxychorismate synthase-like glutamine amidotransferase
MSEPVRVDSARSVVIIDHQDSFVYNLSRYVGRLGIARTVCPQGTTSLAEVIAQDPSHLILSPGPGVPEENPLSLALVAHFSGRIPMLGVCLGHQIIAAHFGATVCRAKRPMHGMASEIVHDGSGLFQGEASPLVVGRYHSLIVASASMPPVLRVNAHSTEGEVMALRHVSHPTYGVQFHPESILTPAGEALIARFLD